jgi:hypothetical protein
VLDSSEATRICVSHANHHVKLHANHHVKFVGSEDFHSWFAIGCLLL